MEPTNKEMMATVEKAAAFLDSYEDFPNDWRDRINLGRLDLLSSCDCICGQALYAVGGDRNRAYYAAHEYFITGAGRQEVACHPFLWQPGMVEAWKSYILATRSEDKKATGEEAFTETPAFAAPANVCEGEIRRRPKGSILTQEEVGSA